MDGVKPSFTLFADFFFVVHLFVTFCNIITLGELESDTTSRTSSIPCELNCSVV